MQTFIVIFDLNDKHYVWIIEATGPTNARIILDGQLQSQLNVPRDEVMNVINGSRVELVTHRISVRF